MNIFFLSYSPEQSARWMVDKHVVKMILESAQLLSTAHRVLDGTEYYDISSKRKIKRWDLLPPRDMLYKATHVNHPSAVWVRESVYNYEWLYDHFAHLLNEYNYRFEKIHACSKLSMTLSEHPINIPDTRGITCIKCAMDEKYIVSDDPIINYRNYYRNGKQHLFKWTKREPPTWITNQ